MEERKREQSITTKFRSDQKFAYLSWSIVLLGDFAPLENLQRGISLDVELAAGILASFCAVDFGQGDRGVIATQQFSGLCEFRFQFLAVAAPEREELICFG